MGVKKYRNEKYSSKTKATNFVYRLCRMSNVLDVVPFLDTVVNLGLLLLSLRE